MDIHSEIQQREKDFQAELAAIEQEGEAKLLNYKKTLDFLKKVEKKLKEAYPQLLPVRVCLIFRYGSQLVHKMYNSIDTEEQITAQKALSQFVKAINQDINSANNQSSPQETIQLIQQN